MALKLLQERQHKNPVASVFLVSSVSSQQSQYGIKNMIERYDSSGHCGSYSVNTFGYGADHNSKLMTWIADQKDGNFYYIEKL